jgi:multidrug transporter EmrE-like cation transporter
MRRLIRLWMNLATNFSVLPLRLAILAGAGMGVLGLLAALYVVIEGLMGHTPSGWASLMTVTLLIAGVQFLILGVLGEYVGRSFMSANGKPQGVVREILPARDGQILLKSGASSSVAAEGSFFDQLFRLPTMVGLVCYGGAALLYIIALRRIPMSVALPCTAASYIAIAIIGWAVFGETLGLQKIAAIALIATGVALLATSA